MKRQSGEEQLSNIAGNVHAILDIVLPHISAYIEALAGSNGDLHSLSILTAHAARENLG